MARKKSGKGSSAPSVTPKAAPTNAPKASAKEEPKVEVKDAKEELPNPIETSPAVIVETEAADPAVTKPVDTEPATSVPSTIEEEAKEQTETAKVAEAEQVVTAKNGENKEEGKEEDGGSSSALDDLPLFAVPVKGPGGEEIELQVNPSDTVMDLRQFLAEAPETCFYTCYDLILTTKDGVRYHLIDYIEIGEVTDVSAGGCSLEMFPAFYDDRSVRFHVRKFRELVSTVGSFSSHATSLAANHEAAHGGLTGEEGEKDGEGKKKKEDSGKIPVELEHLGLAEPTNGLLAGLQLELGSEESDCLQSLAYSSLNPAPGYRRLQGDLMYFELTTLEGSQFCLTAHTRGFTVNATEGQVLNPQPREPKQDAVTIVGLLKLISPGFSAAFTAVVEKKASRHPFENMTAPIPPNHWLGPHPLPPHTRQVSRAEDALMSPFGTEVTGIQRDWNEELQSCRELPKATPQDRLMRDRALYRVTCEFVDASLHGAKAVIGRSIPPINPTDPERFHMYVHNSIFFSLAVDGDFAMLQQKREKDLAEQAEKAEKEKEGGEKSSKGDKVKVEKEEGKKEDGKKEEGKEGGEKEGGVDGEGSANGVQDAEQATYASANNDLKGTKLINDADVAGLSTLAMAIVDYRGHRVIAQSIIPGILYGDKTAALKYGSVDNGVHIKFNEKFHIKMCEVGKLLHLKEHEVKDSEGTVAKLSIPVECKGILGSDDRQYLLDLIRLTPRDANYTAAGSKLCVVRPELLSTYCEKEEIERWMKANGAEERPSAEKIKELKEKNELPAIAFNPNVLTDFSLVGDEKEIKEDEEEVKKLAAYLTETAIPSLIADFKSLEVSPVDGQSLTEALHAKGINMRYLGKIAKEVESLPHFYRLCVTEMVVRACKHVLKAVLRETLDQDVGGAIAHFTNCFIGTSGTTLFAASADSPAVATPSPPPPTAGTAAATAAAAAAEAAPEKAPEEAPEKAPEVAKKVESAPPPSKGKGKKGKGGKKQEVKTVEAEKVEEVKVEEKEEEKKGEEKKGEEKKGEEEGVFDDRPGYTRITAEMVWSDIVEGVKFKYQFELPKDVRSIVRHISTLRNLALKLGIVLAARDYVLDCSAPLSLDDVQDILPVVKHTTPVSQDAQVLLEKGQDLIGQVGLPKRSKILGSPLLGHWLQQNQYKLNEAYETFTEAYNLLQQITGPLNPDVALCCRQLATILYHAGETQAAVLQQHRQLIINERCLGADHPVTAHSYTNLALSYHQSDNAELALRHVARSLALLAATCGREHPETANTFVNLATIYQDTGLLNPALRYLQEALKCNERLLGEDHVQTADSYHALALASSAMRAFKLSVQHEKKAFSILEKVLGKEHNRTKESAMWLQSFLRNEVNFQRQKQVQSQGPLKSQSVQAVAEALKQNPELLKALQQAGGQGTSSLSPQAMAEALVKFQQTSKLTDSPAAAATPNPAMPPGLRRGVDERAAKATEAIRKKAAARGVPVKDMEASGKPTGAEIEEILKIIGQQSTASSPKPAGAPAPGGVAGLGSGLGVGLGAVTGAAPPTKGSSSSGKKAAVTANGKAVEEKGSSEKQPVGLGLGLEAPGGKKGKQQKGKKIAT